MSDIQTQLPVKGSLTNNTILSTSNQVGALTALATAAAQTWGEGNEVLLSTDLSGNLRVTSMVSGTSNVNLTQVGGVAVTLGQTTMASSFPVVIASNQSNLNVIGTLTHNALPPATLSNVGVLPAIASASAPTYTAGNQVLLSTDTSGNLRVTAAVTGTSAVNLTQVGGSSITLGSTTAAFSLPVTIATDNVLTVTGNKTNNAAAPGTNNLGALVALANAVAPTWTEGNEVLLSSDLLGNLRVSATPAEVTTGIVAAYVTETSLASGSTSTTLTYTVTAAKTLYLKQIIAASSGGPCRVQVDYGVGPTIICVGFYSTTSPNYIVEFAQPIAIAASTVVRIKIQNNAGAAQDVYGFFGGAEQS